VIVGDAVHTATWHQHGLTIPTPGTNPIANAGYAAHMMGMNLMLVGSLMTGLSALRHPLLPRGRLPTSPSGGLWLFSVTMIVVGARLSRGQAPRLAAA
jgi:hypothetical protein